MRKNIWDVARCDLWWLAKKTGGVGLVWNCGSPNSHFDTLLNLSHFKQCLSQANISQWRSITLVKNCLWWGFSLDTKRKPYNMGLFIHCCRSWRGGDAFLKLVLIMGQVVLDAFSHLRFWGGVGVRGSPDFKLSHFLRGLELAPLLAG